MQSDLQYLQQNSDLGNQSWAPRYRPQCVLDVIIEVESVYWKEMERIGKIVYAAGHLLWAIVFAQTAEYERVSLGIHFHEVDNHAIYVPDTLQTTCRNTWSARVTHMIGNLESQPQANVHHFKTHKLFELLPSTAALAESCDQTVPWRGSLRQRYREWNTTVRIIEYWLTLYTFSLACSDRGNIFSERRYLILQDIHLLQSQKVLLIQNLSSIPTSKLSRYTTNLSLSNRIADDGITSNRHLGNRVRSDASDICNWAAPPFDKLQQPPTSTTLTLFAPVSPTNKDTRDQASCLP